MKGRKEGDSWLDAFKRVRKGMPPPTTVKPGKKGKGVPYKREFERGREKEEDRND